MSAKTALPVTCDQCGLIFDKKVSRIKRHKNHFCSKECRYAWTAKTCRAGNERPCRQCGKITYTPPKWQKENGNFCSQECFRAWWSLNAKSKPKKKCEWCGLPITRHDSTTKRSKHCFCSRACAGLWKTNEAKTRIKEQSRRDPDHVVVNRSIGVSAYTLGCRCSGCIAAAKARDARTYEKRNKTHRERISQIKLSSGCVDCGYKENAVAMDFDHVRGKKRAAIGQMMNCSWQSIEEEMKKCEVRCKNCHAIVTCERRERKPALVAI